MENTREAINTQSNETLTYTITQMMFLFSLHVHVPEVLGKMMGGGNRFCSLPTVYKNQDAR